MVPKRVGDELRGRRLRLGLKQIDVARQLKVTRAYISAVERGVDWDPDADKLVLWARALGWADDRILRKLGRVVVPVGEAPVLTAELLGQIQRAIADGVREGIVEALREAGLQIGNPTSARQPPTILGHAVGKGSMVNQRGSDTP